MEKIKKAYDNYRTGNVDEFNTRCFLDELGSILEPDNDRKEDE